uniref:NAC domain-containing protein 29 n=1 Tax=Anthurium amnicola TaxID=1678845 RepID=A0A1D1Z0V1_9ARAE
MFPLGSTSSPSSIEDYWTDEEIMMFLVRRRSGDPLPSNVLTEVNPFIFDPCNAPDNIWYLCNWKEPISSKGEREIRNTSSGYWKEGRDLKIFTGSQTVGRKVTWEFFRGPSPSGNKTDWMMFEYKLEKKELQATDKAQDFNSLYRVQHIKHMPALEESQNPVSLDDADGDYIQSVLLRMLEQEEENIDLLESTYGSQGSLAVCNRSLEDSRPNHSAELHAACDFPSGDFLELKDLYDAESSSSSDNSSCLSRSSDAYFDSEALLRDLETENVQIVEERHTEQKFSISRSLRTDRVVIKPPSQSSMQNSGADLLMVGDIPSSPAPGRGPQPVSSVSVLPLNRHDGASRHHQDSMEFNLSLKRAGTSQGSVTNRVGRIAKLGKKYFCFASY